MGDKTILDVLRLMDRKAREGAFSKFNPKDFEINSLPYE